MAVFPERIVLKSSTDGDDLVQAATSPGADSEIVPGELVISRGDGTVNLYALDSNNEVVSASVPSLSGLNDVDLDSYDQIPNSSVLVFNSTSQTWENAPAPPYDVAANSIGDLGDVTIGGSPLADGQLLSYNQSSDQWENITLTPQLLANTPPQGALASGEVLRYNADQSDVNTDPIGWEVTKLFYSDVEDRPLSLSDLNKDLSLNDLTDVSLTGPDIGDLIAWDGVRWSTINAQPVDLSNGFLAEIGDVSEASLVSGAVPVYNQANATYEVKPLPYSSISGAPTAVSQLTADVGVSHWANDAGYITNTEGLSSDSLSDFSVTSPQEGQMLLYRSGLWVNEFGPPANISMSRIGELLDVTYYQPGTEPGVLTIDNMGTLNFDSPLSGSGYTQQLTYDVEYGLGMTFFRDIDNSGSAVYVERGRGVTLRADVNIVRLSGRPSTTDNRPELRFETGDSGADVGTGEYISLKMPQTVSESVVYYLPGADGDVGDVLATDGTGNLAWVTQASTPELGDLSDVDLVTVPPVTGQGLIYNAIAQVWLPGAVSNVDLSAESIGALQDVDTSSVGHIPSDGQVLTWHAAMNHWMPLDPQGGSGGGTGSASDIVSETKTTTTGYATLDEIGRSGILVEISCDSDAWISLYPTAASRDADSSRVFEADPAPGSGVLAEAYVETGATVLATPGTVYFNNDSTAVDAIYATARTAEGALIDGAAITITAYPGVTGSPSGGGGSAESLGDLTDVGLPVNVDAGSALVWNQEDSEWQPGPATVEYRGAFVDPYYNSVIFLGTYDDSLSVGGVTPALVNSVTLGPGKFGQAASFPGDAYMSYGNVDTDMTGDFTIDFWVKVNDNTDHGLVTRRNQVSAGAGTWGIITSAAGWKFSDLQTITNYTGSVLTVGQWHHLAVVRAGSTISLYTDGVRDSQGQCTTQFTTNESLRVGNWDTGGTRRLNGLIDDLRITPGISRYTGVTFSPPTVAADAVGSGVPFAPIGKLGDVDGTPGAEGDAFFWDSTAELWRPEAGIKLATLKSEVAASADFADFQSRIAAL